MGLFTGFSVISGIEILYWLWFKVLFRKADKVGTEQVKDACQDCQKLREELKGMKDEIVRELRRNILNDSSPDCSGNYFDVESQVVVENGVYVVRDQ